MTSLCAANRSTRWRASARPSRWSLMMPCLAIGLVAAGLLHAGPTVAATPLGTTVVEPGSDGDAAGHADAFRAIASASTTIGQLVVYLPSTNTAQRVSVGVYSDASGHPGAALTQATVGVPQNGASNSVAIPPIAITPGRTYWRAILSPAGAGAVTFRDIAGGGHAEDSAATILTTLPPTWASGTYNFVATAYDSNAIESAYSAPGTENIPVAPRPALRVASGPSSRASRAPPSHRPPTASWRHLSAPHAAIPHRLRSGRQRPGRARGDS